LFSGDYIHGIIYLPKASIIGILISYNYEFDI
jgi:hypothetical protein